MSQIVEVSPARAEEAAPEGRKRRLWQRICFSDVFLSRTRAQRIAYIGVTAALCIAVNMFEFKFADVQFSLTMFMSMLAGILLGPLPGAAAVFTGDLLGYVVNSAGLYYYWWVSISVTVMPIVTGLIMKVPLACKGGLWLKLAVACAAVFLVCSLAINTTGMYYIGLDIYMSKKVLEAFEAHFGGQQTYWAYFFVRYFILGQIYNAIANFALLFLAVPALNAVKPLRLNIR